MQLNTRELSTNLRDLTNSRDKSSSQKDTTNDDDDDDDDSCSSLNSDENFPFRQSSNGLSQNVKQERYKSIYTSDSASNSCFSGTSKGTQPNDATNNDQLDNNQKENVSNKETQKQISDSQVMFDDDDEFSMDIENEIEFDEENYNQYDKKQSSSQRSQRQKTQSQKSGSTNIISDSNPDPVSSQDRRTSSQVATTSAIKSQTIQQSNPESPNSSAIQSKLSNSNSQPTNLSTENRNLNNLNSEINTNPSAIQTNQISHSTINPITTLQSYQQNEQISLKFDQTTKSHHRQTANTHSTQTKEEEQIKMDSFSISTIEPNSMHNKTINDLGNNESMDFGGDIEEDFNNQSLEHKIEKQKGGYDVFHANMPVLCAEKEKEIEEPEDGELFSDFMNKHRNLLP